ncbi:MAG: PAS domain S-box protein [Vicinamibacterales bacterium]
MDHSDPIQKARMEAALRESEERSRGIIDAALDAVITMDEHGLITAWNPQAEKIFGWSREEAIGRALSSTIIPSSLRAAHERGLRHYLATGEGPVLGRRIEVTAQHRDGREFPVELAISPMPSAGRPAFCGFVRDITERKRAEDDLRQRTVYLNTLVEHSPIAIIGRDSSFRVELLNPAFERLFLYDRSEIIGRDLDAMIAPPDDAHRAEAADVTRRVRNGETVHITTVRHRKDGTPVDVEIYGVPLIEKGRLIGTYALYHDITRQRQLEAQLLHSQKIEAVGTLAGGIAHDFNNLLTTILGYSDLLLNTVDAQSPLRRDLEEIHKAGQRAESLTTQLLAFSRKQLAVLKVLDVADVVGDMDNMIRRLVGHDIQVVTVAGQGGRVKADRGQLEQVLMNLIVNARDAMPHGGALTIEVGTADVQPETAGEPAGIPPGRHVMLAVTDTGVGMDEDTRARVFEPFFSTKEKGYGTGLGLSTVYGIVRQSGGEISIDSEPGRGTRVRIWLPRVDEAVSRVEPDHVAHPAGGTETILLVEDEPSVRRLTSNMLARRGYRVLEATTGEEAVAIAARFDAAIDLILTDAVMPGMPLSKLIAEMRSARPEAKLMVISGHTTEVIVRRGIMDSDIPFLQKPFTSQILLRRVRDILDTPAPPHPPVA